MLVKGHLILFLLAIPTSDIWHRSFSFGGAQKVELVQV